MKTCCGGVMYTLKTNEALSINLINTLTSKGFKESTHYTKAGILYMDNLDFIISGPLGSTKLQVKCKKSKDCDEKLNNFEALLLNLE
jgi:hypothetical protein